MFFLEARWTRRLLPLVLAVILTSMVAAPAAAYDYTESGMVGDWHFVETVDSPIGRCGYSQEFPPNSAFLRWMKVKAPVVYAADRDSDKIDRKRVVWFWKLQKATYGEWSWKTVATSAKQSAIAYENQPAPFSALRIDYNTGTKYGTLHVYRALVVVKWVKKDGTVEGRVRATPSYYRLKLPWYTITSGGAYCQREQTSG